MKKSKRILALIFSAWMVLSLAACGSEKSTDTAETGGE